MIGSPRFNEGSTMSSEPETPSVCLLHHSSAWLSYSRLPHGPRWQLESSHYTPAVGQKKEESQKGKKGLFPAGSAPFKQPSQISQTTFLFNFHWPEHTYSCFQGDQETQSYSIQYMAVFSQATSSLVILWYYGIDPILSLMPPLPWRFPSPESSSHTVQLTTGKPSVPKAMVEKCRFSSKRLTGEPG